MCGIFLYYGDKNIIIDKNIMPERGPDSWGTYETKEADNNIVMFHSRLSIIGLGDQGKQPFEEVKNKVLVYNGEIYNYETVKEELVKDFNIGFKTKTDTEVLYYALIYWGIDKTLDKINGIFAFVFYDRENEIFFLARDNLGVKPLYYYHKDNTFSASSECKAFFSQGICEAILRRELLGEYFANLWILEPDTLFKDIYKLEAGCYLTFKKGVLIKKRYWSLYNTNRDKPDFEKIIKRQMVTADVKVGAYLSGGIDSSLIACALRDRQITFFNLDMGGTENYRLERLKNKFGLTIEKRYPSFDTLKDYEYLIKQVEEPIACISIIPTYEIAKGARNIGCTVMLSGMGGDEIDCGYSRSNIIKRINLYKIIIKLLKLIPEKIIRFILKDKRYSYFKRLCNFCEDISPANYFSLTYYFGKKEVDTLVMYDWYQNYREKIEKIIENKMGIKKYYELDFKGFLASHSMILTDKASMASSVEVRVPLLDKDIVNYFFNDLQLLKNDNKKRLKHELKKYNLSETRRVKKEGFIYPVREWLSTKVNWKEVCGFFKQINLLNVGYIELLVNQLYKNSANDIEMKLWSIFTFYLWIKVFKVDTNLANKSC